MPAVVAVEPAVAEDGDGVAIGIGAGCSGGAVRTAGDPALWHAKAAHEGAGGDLHWRVADDECADGADDATCAGGEGGGAAGRGEKLGIRN